MLSIWAATWKRTLWHVHPTASTQADRIKTKRSSLETNNTPNDENRRLGFIKSLHLHIHIQSLLSTWGNVVALAIRNTPSEDSDQSARMRSLIWIFAGRIFPKVRFWRCDLCTLNLQLLCQREREILNYHLIVILIHQISLKFCKWVIYHCHKLSRLISLWK